MTIIWGDQILSSASIHHWSSSANEARRRLHSSGRRARISPKSDLGYFAKIEDLQPWTGVSRISIETHRPLDIEENCNSIGFCVTFQIKDETFALCEISGISKISQICILRNCRNFPKCKNLKTLCFPVNPESSSPMANPIGTKKSKLKENPKVEKMVIKGGRRRRRFGGGRRPPHNFSNFGFSFNFDFLVPMGFDIAEEDSGFAGKHKSLKILAFGKISAISQSTNLGDLGDF